MGKGVHRVMAVGLVSGVWGLVWMTLMVLIILVVSVVDPADIDEGEGPLQLGPRAGVAGLVHGLGFALALALVHRQRGLASVPYWQGALLALLMSPIMLAAFGKDLSMVGLLAPLCIVSATLSLFVARRWEHGKTGTLIPGARTRQ